MMPKRYLECIVIMKHLQTVYHLVQKLTYLQCALLKPDYKEARHPHFGLSSSDLHFKKLLFGLFTLGIEQQLDQNLKKTDEIDASCFLPFGQLILIEQQVSLSCSSDTTGIDQFIR